jgi:CelD/BcsL family acetyltransferase involved in cellulose biosynthesis
VDIEVTGEVDPAEWQSLMTGDRRATFFHSLAWGQLLAATVPGFTMRYLVGRSDGRVVAGMPAMLRGRAGFAVLESMPYGTYGGPLVRPGAGPRAEPELFRRLARLFRSPRVAAVHVNGVPVSDDSPPRPFRSVAEPAQVVRLGRSYDEIWATFKPSTRNKIRKAEKSGVSVRRASSDADFMAYHAMLAECCRRWGTPTEFGLEFFVELAKIDRNAVQMWIAEHEGDIVAADLNFVYGDTVMNWGNVSFEKARHLATTNLLHATAIRWAIENGFSVYNLGSSRGLPGVESFKSSLGTETDALLRLSAEKAWYRAARKLSPRRAEEARE